MSLRVWLPLNGNLNNQGLSDIAVTNNGATIDNNGKIGKCYYFDGTYISFNRPLPNPCSAFTICGWVKLSTGYAANNGLHLISFETSYGRICISKDGLAVRVLLNYNGTTSATGSTATASSVSANVWNHYAVTFDSGKINIYINGQLDNSYTINISQVSITSSILKVGTYSTESSKGYVNDFRIYDHALSPKEIEILSRGLVCHYPLNGGGRGGDNLLTNTSDLTKWIKESGISVTWDADKGMYKIVDSSHTSSRWGIYKNIDISPNTSYTVTCTLEGDNCSVGFGFYDSSTSFPANVITVTNNTKKRLSYTATSGANSTLARIYLNINCGSSATKTAWFSLPKLEIGDHSTPWIPNSTDPEYAKMGYDSNIEYDVSGYGYDGTKNGTFTYSSDTARYSVSSVFNGSTYISSNPSLSQIQTISVWCKTTKNKNTSQIIVACKESLLCVSFYNGNIISYFGNSSAGTGSKCVIGNSYIENGWNHIVVVATGTNTRKVYINGVELSANSNDYWSDSVNGLFIGTRNTSSNPHNFYGNISDVRLYATALSAEQVAELYNTAVSVANNGTLMGYELVEV